MDARLTTTVVGLGSMGRPMAERLVARGHEVRGWNRTPPRTDAPAAVRMHADLPDAAAGADVVITMLSDDAAVEDVVLGPGGVLSALGPSTVHVSMSTVSPTLTARLAARHRAADRAFVAAPVFGRPDAAAAGALHVVPGGSGELVERLGPIFGALGQRVHPQETPEQASLLKLVGNFMIAATVEALGEALALGEVGGVPPERTLELLLGTLFDAPVLHSYGPQVATRTFTPAGFAMPLGLKDLDLARDAAAAAGLTLPIAEIVRDHMTHALDAGGHDQDWSAISAVARDRAAPT